MAEAGPAAAAGGGGGGGGGPSSSPKSYENLILSNLSSPRFDISDFLKTPTDGSPRDEPMYRSTFPPYTMPHPPPLSLPPFVKEEITTQDDDGGPPAIAPACNVPDASFGNALLFEDCKGGDLGIDHVLQTGDLIPFDEYIDGVLEGRDAFSLFNDVQYNTGASTAPSALGYVPYIHTDNAMLPALSVPPASNGIYAQHEPYLGSEPGGLAEVDERVLVGLDHGALSSAASNLLMYPNNQIDWGMSNTGASTYPLNLGQQSNLQCENCQLLRRIIHSNGVQDTKLEIHGQQGQSYHAVLQTRFCIDDGFPSSLEQQMVDFPVGNCEYVKQFLMQYSMLRSKEGFILRHDSLQVPMDLSCIAPERVLSAVSTQMSNQTGQNKMNQGNCSTDNADPSVMPVKPPKSNAAAQRERTGKLKMSDLAQFFHLPINAAAKELGICPTVLKKICRRNGMRRWPHRKIKSIERIIATLEQTIAEGAGQGDESIRMEIAMLRNERAQLCAGLLGEK